MKYLVINNLEERNIVCALEKVEGRILYSGHKLAIEDKVLPQVLQYYYDKFNSKFMFVNYLLWKKNYNLQPFNHTMTNCLFSEPNHQNGFKKSWSSLLDLMSGEFGKFQKINIVQL